MSPPQQGPQASGGDVGMGVLLLRRTNHHPTRSRPVHGCPLGGRQGLQRGVGLRAGLSKNRLYTSVGPIYGNRHGPNLGRFGIVFPLHIFDDSEGEEGEVLSVLDVFLAVAISVFVFKCCIAESDCGAAHCLHVRSLGCYLDGRARSQRILILHVLHRQFIGLRQIRRTRLDLHGIHLYLRPPREDNGNRLDDRVLVARLRRVGAVVRVHDRIDVVGPHRTGLHGSNPIERQRICGRECDRSLSLIVGLDRAPDEPRVRTEGNGGARHHGIPVLVSHEHLDRSRYTRILETREVCPFRGEAEVTFIGEAPMDGEPDRLGLEGRLVGPFGLGHHLYHARLLSARYIHGGLPLPVGLHGARGQAGPFGPLPESEVYVHGLVRLDGLPGRVDDLERQPRDARPPALLHADRTGRLVLQHNVGGTSGLSVFFPPNLEREAQVGRARIGRCLPRLLSIHPLFRHRDDNLRRIADINSLVEAARRIGRGRLFNLLACVVRELNDDLRTHHGVRGGVEHLAGHGRVAGAAPAEVTAKSNSQKKSGRQDEGQRSTGAKRTEHGTGTGVGSQRIIMMRQEAFRNLPAPRGAPHKPTGHRRFLGPSLSSVRPKNNKQKGNATEGKQILPRVAVETGPRPDFCVLLEYYYGLLFIQKMTIRSGPTGRVPFVTAELVFLHSGPFTASGPCAIGRSPPVGGRPLGGGVNQKAASGSGGWAPVVGPDWEGLAADRPAHIRAPPVPSSGFVGVP
ncbi:hypothetical protein SRU_1771 [Salinibacter ruber DSM 13855]|uniref:Uncharacterized protein n=1 Tax=Salinibacter ruber (strain DSM 13855 / M31) TaxID=309807 RepID=Q2S1P4_SALRD|nr:hypothetical protein SRU_1771 [Salinibacter ruber DSM 13855]